MRQEAYQRNKNVISPSSLSMVVHAYNGIKYSFGKCDPTRPNTPVMERNSPHDLKCLRVRMVADIRVEF